MNKKQHTAATPRSPQQRKIENRNHFKEHILYRAVRQYEDYQVYGYNHPDLYTPGLHG